MSTIDVGTTRFGETLRVTYLEAIGHINFEVVYKSGRKFPSPFGIGVSPVRWDKLVAWVELQRKEKALKESEQKKS